jgi:hypothetical protein
MSEDAAARNQRGALTQAGAGIAASRRNSGDFARLSSCRRPSMLARFNVLAVAAVLLSACGMNTHPRIADIRYNPGRYQNHSVTMNGIVTGLHLEEERVHFKY